MSHGLDEPRNEEKDEGPVYSYGQMKRDPENMNQTTQTARFLCSQIKLKCGIIKLTKSGKVAFQIYQQDAIIAAAWQYFQVLRVQVHIFVFAFPLSMTVHAACSTCSAFSAFCKLSRRQSLIWMTDFASLFSSATDVEAWFSYTGQVVFIAISAIRSKTWASVMCCYK